MSRLRPFIFWPHLIAGVSAGVVILLMCVTGALLTYERQLIAWSDSHLRSVPSEAGSNRLPLDALLARVQQKYPDLEPSAITLGSSPDAPVVLAVQRKTIYVDAYTGAVLGEGSPTMRRVMSELRAWHRWIGMEGEGRPAARVITGAANVVFLFIVISGFYLWFPRRWTWAQVRAVVLFNARARGKARDFNWHNVIGSWSAVPLFIVVISAVPISFSWGNALVYRLVGETPPAPARGSNPATTRERNRAQARDDSRLQELLTRAEQQVPGWRTITVRVPTSDAAPVTFAIDRGDGGQPHLRSTLTIDRATGHVVDYEAFSDLSAGRRIRNIMRFAHTGEVLGIPGQTVAGFATAGGAVLVWTGIALALRRFFAWRRRRACRQEVIGVAESETAA